MYLLEISKLQWKQQIGPHGETCSIKITCTVPQINKTSILIRGELVLLAASILQETYTEHIVNSNIDLDTNTLTMELDIKINSTSIQVLVDALLLSTVQVSNYTEPESDADPKIFVYQAVDQNDPLLDKDMFSNVASRYDMDTLPADEPVILTDLPLKYAAIPFYRVNTVEMDFLTASQANRFVRIVKADTQALVMEIQDAGKYLEDTIVHI